MGKDYERLKERLYARLDQLRETCSDDKDVARLIKRLRRHREELFTLLEHKGVSPYNNQAEQQMPKPVITRKISQQNRSDQGTKTQAIFMTLFRSAELQGRNPVETIMVAAQDAIADKAVAENDLKLAA